MLKILTYLCRLTSNIWAFTQRQPHLRLFMSSVIRALHSCTENRITALALSSPLVTFKAIDPSSYRSISIEPGEYVSSFPSISSVILPLHFISAPPFLCPCALGVSLHVGSYLCLKTVSTSQQLNKFLTADVSSEKDGSPSAPVQLIVFRNGDWPASRTSHPDMASSSTSYPVANAL